MHNELNEVLVRLRQKWESDPGVTIEQPVEPTTIQAFMDAQGVSFPPDFKEYLRVFGGFRQEAGQDQDREGFNFFPLVHIVPASHCEDMPVDFPGDSTCYIFCDYMIWSWAFAICLVDGGTLNYGHVYMVGTETGKPKLVSDSFPGFLRMYLQDDEALYP